MIFVKMIVSFLILFTFLGCTSHQVEPMMSMKGPSYIDQTTARTTQLQRKPKEGSVFGQGSNPLFADKKAMRINDIVTVRIDERTYQLSQGDKKIAESSSDTLGGGVYGGTGLGGNIGRSLNYLTDISFKTNSQNQYQGKGSQSRNEKFNATISARIVRILNNGNYFIAGSRELLLNGTKQIVKITGVIRPFDIDQNNEIDSKYIADAKIYYETQGDIKQATTKPWGSRIVESVWPF